MVDTIERKAKHLACEKTTHQKYNVGTGGRGVNNGKRNKGVGRRVGGMERVKNSGSNYEKRVAKMRRCVEEEGKKNTGREWRGDEEKRVSKGAVEGDGGKVSTFAARAREQPSVRLKKEAERRRREWRAETVLRER